MSNTVYRKLYKRTQTGSIQEWWIERENDKYRTHSGKTGGKIVTSEWKKAYSTNEGRSNERNPIEQAIFEVEALYTKRLDLAYAETPESVDSTGFFECMLAKDLKKTKVDFSKQNVYSQPKLDGIRAIITVDGIHSRTGKEIFSCPHIHEAFKPLFEEDPELILDGELYNHEFKDDFNQIVSLVKKTKDFTPEDYDKTYELVQFHWYDIVSDEPYSYRMIKIQSYEPVFRDVKCVEMVPTTTVHDHESLMAEYERYVSDGYEGQIIRIDGVGYEKKRTKNLLKHKDFDDSEFRIISIEEGKGNRSGMAGFVVCELGDGTDRTFKASIKGTHEFCKGLLRERDKYANGEATIQHFRRTPDGIPRFPVAKALYETKRDL